MENCKSYINKCKNCRDEIEKYSDENLSDILKEYHVSYNLRNNLCIDCQYEMFKLLTYIPKIIVPFIKINNFNEVELKGHGRKTIQKYIDKCYKFKINNLQEEISGLQGEELANYIRLEGKRNNYDKIYHCSLWAIDYYKKRSHNKVIKIKDLINIIHDIKRYTIEYDFDVWNDEDFIIN